KVIVVGVGPARKKSDYNTLGGIGHPCSSCCRFAGLDPVEKNLLRSKKMFILPDWNKGAYRKQYSA
ncbi:MAG TPA: hypothetical protein PLK12_16160, partial [Prolixibacteraceae bacterium]|nr:hypothetical protein [Prolixibacteraceae bacterium]